MVCYLKLHLDSPGIFIEGKEENCEDDFTVHVAGEVTQTPEPRENLKEVLDVELYFRLNLTKTSK